jgi:photosystem II stability/assembly factor-like uncharacterized protein
LLKGTSPADSQQPLPPLSVQAALGAAQVTLTWDKVIGATSYNLFVGLDPALNQTNYSSLAGGRKIAGVASPYTIQGLTNRAYFVSVSSVEGTVEGSSSPPTMVGAWSIANAPQTNYHALATGLTSGATAYAAGGLALYATTNGGADWNALEGGSGGFDIRAIAVGGARVYAATQDKFNTGPAQILRSLDSGTTWSTLVPDAGQLGEQNRVLVIDPADPARLYAADFRLPAINIPGDSYVISSLDGGDSWFHLPNPTAPLGAEIHAYAMVVDPLNSSIIYAGGTGTPNLVRSSDYGTNWTDANVGPGYVYSLAIDPSGSGTLYAGVVDSTLGSRGVLRSTNSGGTWLSRNAGFLDPLPKVYSLVIDPLNPQHLHAGTDMGYYFSPDGGELWRAGNAGFSSPAAQNITALALTSSRQLLAASGAGIFRLDLSIPSIARPQLSISRAGGAATLFWPASADAFSLQIAEDLGFAASWTNFSNPILITNGLRIVTLDLTNSGSFFRLISP